MADSETSSCSSYEGFDAGDGSIGLRISAIFIILASSTFLTLFPIVTRRVPRLSLPGPAFDFAKYFGSGVIIATAFMHLLAPGVEELSSPCLNEHFQSYDFAFAFALISMFMTFIVELLAFRLGSKIASRLAYDPSRGGHHHAAEHNHTSAAIAAKHKDEALVGRGEGDLDVDVDDVKPSAAHIHSHGSHAHSHFHGDPESLSISSDTLSAAASEILGVMVLEFGVIFHSFIIGLTLATTSEFIVLFIVIIFHQMFEGLGLGVRLALLPLSPRSWIPWAGALAYSCVTPLGMAVGLGIRHTYNADGATANYVTGTFDSVSAGILFYTGLVELLAHEFIFNEKMRTAPLGKVMLSVAEVLAGAGIMALLARWA